MKNIKLIQQATFVLLLVVVTCSFAQAQITLQKYDDPDLGGRTKSITFGGGSSSSRSDGASTRKVFNIQENNPYNQLNFPVVGDSKGGPKNYSMSIAEFTQLKGSNTARQSINDSNHKMEARSLAYVRQTKGRFAIAYNLLLYDKEGYPSEYDILSTIIVLDNQGNITNRFEGIPTDVFNISVSANGRYLIYCYGEKTAHSTGDIENGLKILDLNNNSIYFEMKHVSMKIAVFSRQTLRANYFSSEGEMKLILDENDGHIYKVSNEPGLITKGYLEFMNSKSGSILSKSDLTRIK